MIENGKAVKVHFKGTLGDGTVFDSSEGRDPIEFVVGEGSVIPGFESAVTEMAVAETKTITIPCAEAYGETREEMVGQIPLANLPEDMEPEVGMMLQMNSPEGSIPVRIVGLEGDMVTLDANHPLAGEDLTFELTLVEIG
ncbi:peptidylprolyl isomerase [bacterium]|nr:peptidylprolyl isomerase [bacterium]PJA73396.1 MAG: peptidylprolyl isomerase [bacterium CG_4_9_14_3_um_filter_65_15]